MLRYLSSAVIALGLAVCACAWASPQPLQPSAQSEPSTEANLSAATASAKSWLALVDEERYADSWSATAKLFQDAVTRENWMHAVAGARRPFGKLISRRIRSADYKTSVPGAPDGKYVVIQFDTAFEKKAKAVETVTPMLEVDRGWRVSGYFIK